MIENSPKKKILNWTEMIQKLVVENCFSFGNHSRLTSKKVTKYLVGTRVTTEIFKLYELRYLLLKIYPLMHNLFYNPRLNSNMEKKSIANFMLKDSTPSVYTKQNFKNKLTAKVFSESTKKKQNRQKVKFSFQSKQKRLRPQIVFATTTPAFAYIIKQAAQICNMPSHQNRWSNGFITAGMSSARRKNLWNFSENCIQDQIRLHATSKWEHYNENYEQTKQKRNLYRESHWPSLLIIPDVSNNSMIVQEAKKMNLPVVGIVNSHCFLDIDYPIFAQDQTFQSVHFFCYFLATLVVKENLYLESKRSIQKVATKSKALTTITHLSSNNNKNFFFKREIRFQNLVMNVNKNRFWNKTLFFHGIKSIRKKQLIRQHLLIKPYFFSSLITRNLSHFQRYLEKHIPPNKLLFKLLHLYLKICIKFSNTNEVLKVFLKDIIKFYGFKRNKWPTNSLINSEKINRYFKNRVTYFWNSQEKKKIWRQLEHYAKINKITQKQWKIPIFKPSHRFWIHSYYFWIILQQWHNDLKWSGHKYILNRLMTNTQGFYELITRQKIGPKWKSRVKCYINSRSYKYVPRNDYLLGQEKEKTKEWISKINTTLYSQPRKRLGYNSKLKEHYLQKQYNRKQKRKHQKSRQAWYKH